MPTVCGARGIVGTLVDDARRLAPADRHSAVRRPCRAAEVIRPCCAEVIRPCGILSVKGDPCSCGEALRVGVSADDMTRFKDKDITKDQFVDLVLAAMIPEPPLPHGTTAEPTIAPSVTAEPAIAPSVAATDAAAAVSRLRAELSATAASSDGAQAWADPPEGADGPPLAPDEIVFDWRDPADRDRSTSSEHRSTSEQHRSSLGRDWRMSGEERSAPSEDRSTSGWNRPTSSEELAMPPSFADSPEGTKALMPRMHPPSPTIDRSTSAEDRSTSGQDREEPRAGSMLEAVARDAGMGIVVMCVDRSVDMCVDMCAHICVDLCVDMWVAMNMVVECRHECGRRSCIRIRRHEAQSDVDRPRCHFGGTYRLPK